MRNLGLSANQVVHIPLAGDYQLARLEALEPPTGHHASAEPGAHAEPAPMQGCVQACVPDPALQESLQRENVPDPLVGEQTWPTHEARGAWAGGG